MMKDNKLLEKETMKTVQKGKTMSSTEIFNAGLDSLVKTLGLVNAERFITIVKKDDFDYTKWRRDYFGDKDVDSLCDEAVAYSKSHPHQGKGTRI